MNNLTLIPSPSVQLFEGLGYSKANQKFLFTIFTKNTPSIGETVTPIHSLKEFEDYNYKRLLSLSEYVDSQVDCIKTQLKVDIENFAEIVIYLVTHNDLLSILQDACLIARNILGKDGQISLSLTKDDNLQYLTLNIRQKNYQEDVLEKIDIIENSFVDKLKDKSGWLIVTSDYKKPNEQ